MKETIILLIEAERDNYLALVELLNELLKTSQSDFAKNLIKNKIVEITTKVGNLDDEIKILKENEQN